MDPEQIGTQHMATGPVQKPAIPDPVATRRAIEEAVNSAIQQWYQSNIRGSAVSQANEANNHLLASLPALRDFIMREL